MPVYDYKCPTHGVFYELASLADSAKPCACPNCGQLSARIILIPPGIFKMARDAKRAHEVNEKSRHEPLFSTPERRETEQSHASACGCAIHRGNSRLMLTARGEKMFPSMRPWMISH
ncbi:MAG: FmdB family zinc ribbon protein [Gammaproteobacteria bacterium]